jgi:hypothetical protein
MVGDALLVAGTGVVIVSLFLTWYRVTITAVGMQFYQALLSHLFPQTALSLGGLTGPLTMPVSALGKEAGGWRWAILVVSIVLVLEVVLAIGSGVTRQIAPAWPHTTIVLVLSFANLVLLGAAFFNLPYNDVPSAYISVSHGIGSYVGPAAGILAFGGALARAFRPPAGKAAA